MSSCSKGSRGLSVLPRVSRIFTTSAISPGPWLRQRPNRYAFRAGRNLPDKEFRYLRTVSYGAILPSSLTMVLPIALVCSTHPPVSVCGTGPCGLPRGFSWKHGLTGFAHSLRPAPQPSRRARFTTLRPTCHRGDVQNPVQLPFSVAPSVMTPVRGCRNVDLLCIGYAFRPRLSSRLTLGGLASPRKPWVYGGGVSHAALVTHASILTSGRSTSGHPGASPRTESSPTTRRI